MRRDISISKMQDPNFENYIRGVVEELDEYPERGSKNGIGNSVPQFAVHLENEFINFSTCSGGRSPVVGVPGPICGA